VIRQTTDNTKLRLTQVMDCCITAGR